MHKFFSLAPAVCPLIIQSHSNIVESDFIVLGSRKITLVHEKTSPIPITCGCFIADFSCDNVKDLLLLNFASTGSPPGTTWNILIGKIFS